MRETSFPRALGRATRSIYSLLALRIGPCVSVPFSGSVIGYFLGGVMSRVHGDTGLFGLATSWRTPFAIQSVALLPLVVLLACLPASAINVPSSSPSRRLLATGEW